MQIFSYFVLGGWDSHISKNASHETNTIVILSNNFKTILFQSLASTISDDSDNTEFFL